MEANPDYWAVLRSSTRSSSGSTTRRSGRPGADQGSDRLHADPDGGALRALWRTNRTSGRRSISAEAFYQVSFNLVGGVRSGRASTADPAVRNPAFRRAVAHAIDKERWSTASPADTPNRARRRSSPLYDFWHWEPPPDEAIGVRPGRGEDGSWTRRGTSTPTVTAIRESPVTEEPARAQAVRRVDRLGRLEVRRRSSRGGCEDIGIDVRSDHDRRKLYDFWYESLDWDMIIYSWGIGPDPDFVLSSFTSGQCGWILERHLLQQPRVRRTSTSEQQTTLDETERQAIVHEMQQIIYQDIPEIVLWYPNSFEAWRPTAGPGSSVGPSQTGCVLGEHPYSVMNDPSGDRRRGGRPGRGTERVGLARGDRRRWSLASCSPRAVAVELDAYYALRGRMGSWRYVAPQGPARRWPRWCSCWSSTSSSSASCRATPSAAHTSARCQAHTGGPGRAGRRDSASTRRCPRSSSTTSAISFEVTSDRRSSTTVAVRDGRVPHGSCGRRCCWSARRRS